jgi:uncharacterized Ntn-hydrolase superfamily protein
LARLTNGGKAGMFRQAFLKQQKGAAAEFSSDACTSFLHAINGKSFVFAKHLCEKKFNRIQGNLKVNSAFLPAG